ncbi:hypothetical protein LCGC14_0360190 [marine sediment metagenome]|uniref:PD-(D/E)XK endonuclease-like domain-containing protein n=1 Tax=marine sediment metagenome TaxID=412755 RepID=A0A0F9T8C7_9ZZZZ
MTKKKWRLSASFFSAFKACAMRCKLKYVLGLVPIKTTDSLRMGTNWHSILEITKMKPGSVCPECSNTKKNPECPLCEGTDILPDDMMDAVIRHLNKAYETVPMSKTKAEWLTERAILLYSLCGYNWVYAEDNYEVVAEEIEFNLSVLNPATGRALPNVTLRGKIDKIVRSPNGVYYIDEHKSTGSSIDSDSTFWSHLTLDTQTKLYPYAAQRLQLAGDLEEYGIKPTDPLIRGVRYDVWHKPGIGPKKLTQADSQKLVETGEYLGEEFSIEVSCDSVEQAFEELNDRAAPKIILINGESAEVEPGKKEGTCAIRETPEMFGTRLLADIGERQEFYFARREISRTDKELEALAWDIYNIYHTIKFMYKSNAWWTNEQQCEAKFRCSYIPICYNNVNVDDGTVPDGFKCIFKKEKEK